MTDDKTPPEINDPTIRVALLTAQGEYVTTAMILPYKTPPDILIWGVRVFKISLDHPDIYNECFAVTVTQTEDRSRAVPLQVSGAPKPTETYAFILNGDKRVSVSNPEVSYAFLVRTAFPGASAGSVIMTYKNAAGPEPDGTLGEGQTVMVRREGTIFNVVVIT